VALADVFDALSMERPYKQPWPTEKILAHVKAGAGAHFDPDLVQIFCKILPQLLEIQNRWATQSANEAGLPVAEDLVMNR
jgi:putative two-component system response regulator